MSERGFVFGAKQSIWVAFACLVLASCGRRDVPGYDQRGSQIAEAPQSVEICDNGEDDDGNSAVDCLDAACRGQPNCQSLACVTVNLESKVGANVYSGSTEGLTGVFRSSCGGATAPESGLLWTAPAAGVYTIDTVGSSFDTIVTVLDAACNGVEIACNDDLGAGLETDVQSASAVNVKLEAEQVVVIMVDGRLTSAGTYIVNITPHAGGSEVLLCHDGYDNDGDLRIDCADDDCKGDPACPIVNCPEVDLGSALGLQLAQGTSADGEQQMQGSCGGTGREHTYRWTVPSTGVYTFDTNGSFYDTALYLLENGCAGRELACRTLAMASEQPAITLPLVAGQSLIIVVDVVTDASGVFALNIWESAPIENCSDGYDNDGDALIDCADRDCAQFAGCLATSCPNADLGSVLGERVASGSMMGARREFSGRCGGASGPERTYQWTAPHEGSFRFDARSSDFEVYLYVLNGSCRGSEIGCDKNEGRTPATVTARLTAGQRVIVVIDSYSWQDTPLGQFSIDIRATEVNNCGDAVDNDNDGLIDCLDPDCIGQTECIPPCPERHLGSVLGQAVASGTTADYPSNLTGACGGYAPERVFSWTAPATATFVFDTEGSTFDTIFYVLKGTCENGDELGCNNDARGDVRHSLLQLNLLQGQTVLLVVDGGYGLSGAFQLNIKQSERGACADGVDNDGDGQMDCADVDCAPEAACCVAESLEPVFNRVVASGSDNATWSTFTRGSCGGAGREKIFSWTAPAAGTFTFDTFDSSFDTIMYIREGGCGGRELACNDDVGGSQSKITMSLQAGQTIAIVLDSYGSFSLGPYKLTIRALSLAYETGLCTNGQDDDKDNLIDCADPDCAADARCVGTQCGIPDTTSSRPIVFTDLGSALGTPLVADGNTRDATNTLAGECGGGQGRERVYRWKAPRRGVYTFDTLQAAAASNALDTVVYLLDATCKGNGLPCDDNDAGTMQSRVTTTLEANQVVFVVVDGTSRTTGNFVLNISEQRLLEETLFCTDGIDNDNDTLIDCADPDCAFAINCPPPGCADRNLGSLLGQVVVAGTTAQKPNSSASLCGGGEAPEVTHSWKAPADGTYTFSTLGSSFDTVLYLQDATCDPTALRCDDNEGLGRQSSLTYTARAGETLMIVVDGANGASGAYVLNITKNENP